MATVIVEDGSIVPGANSFVDRDTVKAYADARRLTFDIVDTDAADAAVLEAGDYLKNEMRYVYRGARISYAQTMPYPRQGASEYRGPAIPSNVVPWRLCDAQCALAVRAKAAPGQLQIDLDHGGKIKSEKVDVLETTYADGAGIETLIMEVQGLLNPLLLTAGMIPAQPFQGAVDDPASFQAGTFSNPVGSTDGLTVA
jgi:hypothetical protein